MILPQHFILLSLINLSIISGINAKSINQHNVIAAENDEKSREKRSPQLPPGYSGSSDFAFDGDISNSRYGEYPNVNQNSPGRGSNLIDANNWQNIYDVWQNQNNVRENIDDIWQNQQNQDNAWQNQNNVQQNQDQNRLPLGTPTLCEKRCHQHVTSEYNPICGSDNITYLNPSKFKCALKCGKNITGRSNVSCGFGRPSI